MSIFFNLYQKKPLLWHVVCGIHHAMKRLLLVPARQQVVDALTKEIVSGNLKPCQPLYERDLAEKLGVSRTPIREALQALATAGFVETKSRVGWSVSIPDVKSVREMFQIRMILEATGVEAILDQGNELFRANVCTLFDPFTVDNIDRNVEQYLKVDDKFHKSLIESINNSKIKEIYDSIALWNDWVRHFISYETTRVKSLIEHKEICESLKNRHLQTAKERLEAHIKRVGDELALYLKTKGGETVPAILK